MASKQSFVFLITSSICCIISLLWFPIESNLAKIGTVAYLHSTFTVFTFAVWQHKLFVQKRNAHYYFCCLIACGIAKPIAIPVGVAMIFLLKSNSSNAITSSLYSRDMGFYNPSYQLSSLVRFKTTSLN